MSYSVLGSSAAVVCCVYGLHVSTLACIVPLGHAIQTGKWIYYSYKLHTHHNNDIQKVIESVIKHFSILYICMCIRD